MAAATGAPLLRSTNGVHSGDRGGDGNCRTHCNRTSTSQGLGVGGGGCPS